MSSNNSYTGVIDDNLDDELTNFFQNDNQQHQRPIPDATATTVPPTPVMSQSATQQSINYDNNDNYFNQSSNYVMSDVTAVDGFGMWTSWTRVFDQPRYACLDLLDNCLDATLAPNFDGRVVMKRLPPNGMIILNNSARPIKTLKEVLVVYASSKRDGKEQRKTDAIGENGVGLKHGCATLSDTNFVLTRNFNTYSLGLIARSLQTKEGVNLPSFEFTIEDEDEKTPQEIAQELRGHIDTIVGLNPKIAECVQRALGQGSLNAGIGLLVERCQEMWNDQWDSNDHVFQVIIAELIHSHDQQGSDGAEVTSRRAHNNNNPASLFLHEMKRLLPKYYINIPTQGFEFYVENEKIIFSYWQHRLVEMTKFRVNVPKEIPIQDMKQMNWADEGYPLSIYCGFEALRVGDDERGDACQMYIYSRASGRLIKHDDDARAILNLAASGVDYCQGLTIIIDDVDAQLPLMPTKQGIAWTEQRGGETHRSNLMAWAGACAHCFWGYHSKTFQRRCETNSYKTLLRETLVEYGHVVERQVRTLMDPNRNHTLQSFNRLEDSDFSLIGPQPIPWKHEMTRLSRKLKIKTAITKDMFIIPGTATIFKFTDEHYPTPKQAPAPVIPRPGAKKRAFDNSIYERQQLILQQQRELQQRHQQQQWRQHQMHQVQVHQMHQPDVIVLDDDDAKPAAVTSGRRSVARKSTSGAAPRSNGASTAPVESNLRLALNGCQEELREMKHVMAKSQIEYTDTIRRLREELKYAQQAVKESKQAGGQNGQPASTSDFNKARDEVMIMKRKNQQLEREVAMLRRDNGVSNNNSELHEELARLKEKTEKQAHEIERLKASDNGGNLSSSPKNGGGSTWMSRMVQVKREFEGTDDL